jgi:hypothetical protein
MDPIRVARLVAERGKVEALTVGPLEVRKWNRRANPCIGKRLACASLLGRAAPQHLPPNIVFTLVDDMGWRDLGCYGSSFYETPNIDRFARESVRFTNAYAACPVCSPTRASIMTGKYPARLHLTDWIPGRKQWPTAKLLTPRHPDKHGFDLNGYPSGAVRAGDYKLSEFYEDGRLELYNLARDIRESGDLSTSDPKRVAWLHQKLKNWRESVGAVMPVPNPDYDPATAHEGLTGENPPPSKQRGA